MAKAQAESPDIASDLRRQAAEGYQRTPAGVHGGTNLDHGVGPNGTRITPTISRLFDSSNTLASED